MPCRLCDGETDRKFTLQVLEKYQVDYSECRDCRSLQTTEPFWLEETYGGTLPNLDTGAGRRPIRTAAIVLLTAKILGVSRAARLLDFGGGDGLTCRILRDLGFDAFVYDKYARNFYAEGFSGDPNESYDIVCGIELLEHLSWPRQELDTIFSRRPGLIVLATDLYDGQGPDWPYLGARQGGHVFFYSVRAIELIARDYGYSVVVGQGTAIFCRDSLPQWQRALLYATLWPSSLLAGRIWIQAIRPRRREQPSHV